MDIFVLFRTNFNLTGCNIYRHSLPFSSVTVIQAVTNTWGSVAAPTEAMQKTCREACNSNTGTVEAQEFAQGS